MDYDNTNRGMLMRNENKTADNHPDYSGSINVDGTEYWLSAWVKESKKTGKKFFSMSVKPKEQQKQAKAKPQNQDMGDDLTDVPF